MTQEKIKRKGRVFSSPDAMQKQVDLYFTNHPIQEQTISGLALHLGFDSRASFYNYANEEGFGDVVRRARLRKQKQGRF